jgi:alpha-L-fucosidase 2
MSGRFEPQKVFLMKRPLLLLVCSALGVTGWGQSPASSPLTLWYQKPARDAMDEALPVGNGTIGGVEQERIQLNIDSLWTGDDHGYGAYQTLGNLYLGSALGPKPIVTCTSGQHANGGNEEVNSSTDHDFDTKWCVPTDGQPVTWQVQFPTAPPPVTSYTLVSANDVPERDPKNWEFSGSLDGQNWTVLDKHANEAPFEKRKEAKTFTFANTVAYTYYRLNITENNGDAMTQLAEIEVPSAPADANEAALPDYRRELDLATAVARTSFTRKGVPYVRDVFASHPDQVIAVRLESWRSRVARVRKATTRTVSRRREATTRSRAEPRLAGEKEGGRMAIPRWG